MQHRCPICNSEHTVKSKSKNIETLVVRLIPFRPFRCLDCFHRFWRPEGIFKDRNRAFILIAIALIAVLAIVVPSVLRDVDTRNSATEIVAVNDSQANAGEPAGKNSIVKASASQEPVERESTETSDSTSAENALQSAASPTDKVAALPNMDQIQSAKSREKQLLLENLKRQQSLLDELKNRESELASLLRTEVFHAIESWRVAWERGNVESYFDQYMDGYQPTEGTSHQQWRTQRMARVPLAEGKDRKIKLSTYELNFLENYSLADLRFTQRFQSSQFSDTIYKQIVLKKIGQRWLILEEKQIKG